MIVTKMIIKNDFNAKETFNLNIPKFVNKNGKFINKR